MDIYEEQKDGILKHAITGGLFNPDFLKAEIEEGSIIVNNYIESEEEKALLLEQKASDERAWRNEQLDPLRYEIDVIEDSGGDASILRSYRQQLKDYPQKIDFPNCERPVHP